MCNCSRTVLKGDKGDQGIQGIQGPEGSFGYKIYVGLLNQTGTSDPTSIVLENTLSGTPTLVYVSTGLYYLNLSAEFVEDKTAVFISNPDSKRIACGKWLNANRIEIGTMTEAGVLHNDGLVDTAIEIRVYP